MYKYTTCNAKLVIIIMLENFDIGKGNPYRKGVQNLLSPPVT